MVAIPPSHQRKQATPPREMDKDVEHDQHCHLKSTRHWPFQATTGDFATIDPRHAGDTPATRRKAAPMVAIPPKPPTKTSHTTTTNTQRQAEHDQHCHIKDPPAHRRATTPPSTQPPRHTTTQAPTVSSIIPAAHTKKGRALPAAPQKTPHPTPPRPNRSPLHPKHPMSPAFHRGGLHFEQARGGFCDHRPPTRRRHAATQRLW